MTNRTISHDKVVAEQMRDPEFARELVIVSTGLRRNVTSALRLAIRSMGIKVFSDKSGIPISNVSEFSNGKKAWGYKRIKKALAVFELELAVRPMKSVKSKRVA